MSNPIQTTSQAVNRQRRRLLAGAAGLVSIGLIADLAWPGSARSAHSGPVTLVVFDDNGQRLGERTLEKVVKTNAQWRELLSPLAYRVTRHAGTERAFSGTYNKPKRPGFYRCVCCGNALYDAATQFHSGTGWPSFWQPIAGENIVEHADHSLFMTRTAVSCKRCDAHLGHVFNDGPRPTGLRYCMNSVALHFIATGPT